MNRQKPKHLSFDELLKDAKRAASREVNRKKTLAEARTSRERKTAHNILHVKHTIAEHRERVLQGALVRDHLRAVVESIWCPYCENQIEYVKVIELWAKGKDSNGEDCYRLLNLIKGKGDYDYCRQLPITIARVQAYHVCSDCLHRDQRARADGREPEPNSRALWKPEYTIAKLEAQNSRLESERTELQGEVARLSNELRKLQMNKRTFYISFGQAHVHSVNGITLDKDCLLAVEAEDEGKARKRVSDAIGLRWHKCYLDVDENRLSYFPRGIVRVPGLSDG